MLTPDLHNPTRRQFELMKLLKIHYYDGMSWIQAKVLIKEEKRRINKLKHTNKT